MPEETKTETVDPDEFKDEEIPEFDQDSFTGAEKMKGLDKLKEMIEHGKKVFGEIEETVGYFKEAGKGLQRVVEEAQGLIEKAKGEGDAGRDSGNGNSNDA